MNWSAETLKKWLFLEACIAVRWSYYGKKQVFHFVDDHCLCWSFFQWFELRSLERSFIDWCYRFHISMLFNTSLLLSSPNTTTTSPTPILNKLTPVAVDEQIFFQTAAARGISGIFVWLSLIITCHQVRNSYILKEKYLQDTRNESVHWIHTRTSGCICNMVLPISPLISEPIFLSQKILDSKSVHFITARPKLQTPTCINVQVWKGHDLLLFSCLFLSLGVTLNSSTMLGRLLKSIFTLDLLFSFRKF